MSDIPCSTDTTQTFDGENQKIGTYYVYQAATSGSGYDSEAADNSNSPDTFCPLGWQLPYSGTGGEYYDKSKSWRYLINEYNIPLDTTGQAIIRSYPFSEIYSGLFYWVDGALGFFTSSGSEWSSTFNTLNSGYRFTVYDKSIQISEPVVLATGNPIRCAFDISILEKLSMASAFTH